MCYVYWPSEGWAHTLPPQRAGSDADLASTFRQFKHYAMDVALAPRGPVTLDNVDPVLWRCLRYYGHARAIRWTCDVAEECYQGMAHWMWYMRGQMSEELIAAVSRVLIAIHEYTLEARRFNSRRDFAWICAWTGNLKWVWPKHYLFWQVHHGMYALNELVERVPPAHQIRAMLGVDIENQHPSHMYEDLLWYAYGDGPDDAGPWHTSGAGYSAAFEDQIRADLMALLRHWRSTNRRNPKRRS